MIAVSFQYSKKALADPSVMKGVRKPMAVARTTAAHIRHRVTRRAILATKAKRGGQYNTRRPYKVNEAYARKLGLKRSEYKSSAAFHGAARVRRRTFNVSGGMWAGLRVRSFGSSGAITEFAGRSMAQTKRRRKKTLGRSGAKRTNPTRPKATKPKRTRPTRPSANKPTSGARTRTKREPGATMIGNKVKAVSVFKSFNVNVIQPTAAETSAQVASIALAAQKLSLAALGKAAAVYFDPGGSDAQLLREITRAMRVR